MAKRTLASVLEEHGALTVVDAVDIALDVCDALARPNARLLEGGLDLEAVFLVWPASPTMRHVELAALAGGASRRRVADPVVAVAELIFLLVVGAPPSVALSSLSIAPVALAMTIDACLTKDPRAPRTLDELAERVATFASSPPERFERLASRRAETERARLRAERRDTEKALDRLDRAAALRHLDPASVVARPVRDFEAPVRPEILSRLIDAVDRSTGSEASVTCAPPSPLDAGASLKLAPIRLVRDEVASVFEPRVAALSIPPVALAPIVTQSVPPVVEQAKPSRLFTVLVLVAACACVAIGVFAGVHLFRRTALPSVRAISPSPRPSPAPLPTMAIPSAAPSADGAVVTAASLPDMVTTPAALPDARPVQRRVAPRPPKPRETAAPVVEAARNTNDVLPPEAPPYKSQD